MLYHCEINDITGNNLHITDFKKLMAGTKLKIPFLSKEVIDTLEETESFISEYYPKFDGVKPILKEEEKTVKKEEETINISEEDNNEVKIEKKPQTSENSVKTIPKNIPNYNTRYFGNIPPNYPKENIKKI